MISLEGDWDSKEPEGLGMKWWEPLSVYFHVHLGGGGGIYSKLLSRLLIDHKIDITIICNDCVKLEFQNRECLFLDCLCLPDNF